ncbi:MAG: translation elongation factor Ts [Proteobacteria bacterium]|nr:translation elongation factor Ts [Pseudomonadota bacterium]
MTTITIEMIKELRERTSVGVADCRKALVEAEGNIEKAIEDLQKKGIAKAAKKQGRIAAEGKIGMDATPDGTQVALVELNCETDFAAKNDSFISLTNDIAKIVREKNPSSLEALNALAMPGGLTVEQSVVNFTAATGEKATLRRFIRFAADNSRIGWYNHDGGRICVMVDVMSSDDSVTSSPDFIQACEDIAMHIAAMNPPYARVDEIPQEDVDKQGEIFTAQVLEEGKPENIVPKIVEGKIAKWKKDNCLVDQLFVKDSEITVADLLSRFGDDVTVRRFARYEVGEGIEKRVFDLAAEVAEITNA